jgi:hypothetical protein
MLVLVLNQNQILYDVGYELRVHFAMTFGLKLDVVKVSWDYQDNKWIPNVSLPLPPGATAEQVRTAIEERYAVVRRDLARKFALNGKTRFHGDQA